MSNDNNALKPICEPIGQLLHLGMDKTTDLIVKGVCKIMHIENESLKQKEIEQKIHAIEENDKLKEAEQRLKDVERERLVDKKNNVFVDGEYYNFSDLFFNLGLTNKSKEMPILKKYEVKEVCNIFTFECPVGVTRSSIADKIEEIAAFFETYEGNIEIRKHKNLIEIIVITSDIFDKVYNYDTNMVKENDGLKFPVGFFLSHDYTVKLLSVNMAKKGNHAALIAGSSGSGKSSLLRLMLMHLVLNYTPEQLQLIIIAGSGDSDFMFLKNTSPHLYNNKIYMDIDEIVGNEENEKKNIPKRVGILDEIKNEIELRLKRFSEVGVANIDEYYKKGYKDIPYKVIVFDEYSYFASTNKFDDLQSVMGSISQTTRKTGVKVIISLQDSQNKFYSPAIKYNTPLKFCFAAENENHSKNMCDSTGLENIKRIGEGRFFSKYNMLPGRDNIAFKAILPPEDTDVLIKMIKDKYK